MKTLILLLGISAFVASLTGCSDSDDVKCESVEIKSVYPFYGSPNGPVLVEGRGFAVENLSVRFAGQQAQIVEKTDTYISTKVPSGLSGPVELSVSTSGGCIAVTNFEVTAAAPAGFPNSPPTYFIPPAGYSFPVQIPQNQELLLINVYENGHFIHVLNFREVQTIGEFDSAVETWKGTESPVTGSINIPENHLVFKIDRSLAGEEDEELVGGFYTLTVDVNGKTRTDNFFLAFSAVTGKQYLFYKFF